MKYKIITAITTKNEDWIIDKTLKVVSEFSDEIIVYDDGSTDRTKEICLSYDKVKWYERPLHDWWKREEALQRKELIDLLQKHNPDYVFLLDADEIPTPKVINFINNIDKNVNLWSVRMINLWKNEDNYRIDRFRTSNGSNINWDPFSEDAWRKYVFMKYDSNINYYYDITLQSGGCSDYHPAPNNTPKPHVKTEDFYILHYGKISKDYVSGESDKFYAKIAQCWGKGTYEERLKHNTICRVEGNIQLKTVLKEWKWKI